jgi:ubiquinone/menaquinone biosynthesis C-methylase UbiE
MEPVREERMHKFAHGNWQKLESEERRILLPPRSTLEKFGLKQGMAFVDIGAGSGFFSREAATLVGSTGKVFAVEMSAEMVEIMRTQGVSQEVEVVRSGENSIPLPDSVGDLTWIAFVTHETVDLQQFLNEAARVTKSGGRLVIVEWKKQREEHGPAMEERLSQDDLRKQLNGLKVIGEGSLNSSHYYFELEITKPL